MSGNRVAMLGPASLPGGMAMAFVFSRCPGGTSIHRMS